jgi:hypothetical protein
MGQHRHLAAMHMICVDGQGLRSYSFLQKDDIRMAAEVFGVSKNEIMAGWLRNTK